MFKEASRKKSKLRLAIAGPSGAGKTKTALALATGLGGSIAVIDTENKSACKYAKSKTNPDGYTFQVAELSDYAVESYIEAIEEAKKLNINVLIIDSMTHAWQELLERVERVGRVKFKGNSYAGWSEGTPLQNRFIKAIVHYPNHIICTVRVKTKYDDEKDEKTGKIKKVKIGLSPEQRSNVEYEFDIYMEIDMDHTSHITKARGMDQMQDVYTENTVESKGKNSEELGKKILYLLNDGEEDENYNDPSLEIYAKALELAEKGDKNIWWDYVKSNKSKLSDVDYDEVILKSKEILLKSIDNIQSPLSLDNSSGVH